MLTALRPLPIALSCSRTYARVAAFVLNVFDILCPLRRIHARQRSSMGKIGAVVFGSKLMDGKVEKNRVHNAGFTMRQGASFRKKRIGRKRNLGKDKALIYKASFHPLKISISP